MASRYELEITIESAKDLKNVNWRNGPLKPYVVVWVDPHNRLTTRVDDEGDKSPYWDQTLVVPFNSPIEESTLYMDVVHSKADEGTKPLIGSARIHLRDIGFEERTSSKLELVRPSGRPQGKVEVRVIVRQPRYRAPDPYYAPPYGASRDPYSAPAPYGSRYGPSYQAAPPPTGYSYNAAPTAYGQPAPEYGQSVPTYGQTPGYGQEEKKKSKFGMGTGLAVGAVGGLLGGLVLAEGIDHVEDHIADKAAEKAEEDEDDDGDDDNGDYDDDDY